MKPLSLESYQKPMDFTTGIRRPESGLSNNYIHLSRNILMDDLLKDSTFSSKDTYKRIVSSVPNMTAQVIENTITQEKYRYHQLINDGYDDRYFDSEFQAHSPLLHYLCPNHKDIDTTDFSKIQVPHDLVTEIQKKVSNIFKEQEFLTLETLEQQHSKISPEMKRICQEAIISGKNIKENYKNWSSWVKNQVNLSQNAIPWKNIDHLFFTMFLPIRAEQVVETIFTACSLLELTESYKSEASEQGIQFINLLQLYLKQYTPHSPVISSFLDDEGNSTSFKLIRKEEQQDLQILLTKIQKTLQDTDAQNIFTKFISDIHSVDDDVSIMQKYPSFGIFSTKEHWAGSYGIPNLLNLQKG